MTQPVEDALPGLLARVREGDREALAELLSLNRERLIRMIRFRLDPRLERRVDPEDVLQEVYLNAADRLRHFGGDSEQSFFIWLRLIAGQTLIDIHRRHIGARMRAAGREQPIDVTADTGATSKSMALLLAADRTSPSQAAIRAEMSRQIETAMEGMDPIDREILALRHFEELANGEVAEVLGIAEKAASIRYVRALGRLKQILEGLSDFSPRGRGPDGGGLAASEDAGR
jgi:RNA polymerase sigma-70 factor (ECF subfamily)